MASPPDATAAIAIDGPAVTVTTTLAEQNARLTFNGTAGQRISVNASAISPSLTCPRFSVVNPDGSNLSASNTSCSSSYFIGVLTLPATGSYTIVMDPSGANIAK